MARKRMKSKIQPAVQTMSFVFQAQSDAKERRFIDLSQCASLMNRRFYRQGINWAVAGFKVLSYAPGGGAVSGQISIGKLPNTYVMSNAWEKSFRAWQQMIKNATDESGSESIKGKFLDFKIYADADHHQLGFGNNLLPHSSATLAGSIQTAIPGQWDPASVEIPETTTATGASTEYELIAVGPNNPGAGASGLDAKSLIAGYANSRALPSITDPNVPDDSASYAENWMLAIFNEGTLQDSSILDTLELEGNQPPYPYENDGTHTDTMYPGGENNLNTLEIHDQEFITSTTIGGTTVLKGGNFPCGLIAIDTFGFQRDDALILQVNLVPGHHRGYLCEPMTEM